MRRATLLSLALLGLSGCGGGEAAPASTAYGPTDAERTEVLAVVQGLFDALYTGDADLLRSVVHPSVVMHSTETRDGRTTFGSSTVDELADRIGSGGPPLIERMWDADVRVSGAMATVWTPYDFYTGDTLSHCGVDVATLMRQEEGWRIVALSWTRLQPPACTLHPDGPPAG